jgi:hypothetical protein
MFNNDIVKMIGGGKSPMAIVSLIILTVAFLWATAISAAFYDIVVRYDLKNATPKEQPLIKSIKDQDTFNYSLAMVIINSVLAGLALLGLIMYITIA